MLHRSTPNTKGPSDKTSTSSKMIGATLSTAAEFILFHPLGTYAVRLQNHKGKLINPSRPFGSMKNVWNVMANGNPYAGFTVGALDRFAKRLYKFTAQGVLMDRLAPYALSSPQQIAGEKNAKPLLEGLAGGITGVGEVAILPLDNIKINKQTIKHAYIDEATGKEQHLGQIIRSQGIRNLYRGAAITAVRNFSGSSLLFGVSSATYSYGFGLESRKQATKTQDIIASIAGSTASVVLTLPLDVVKTRLQTENKKIQIENNKIEKINAEYRKTGNEGIRTLSPATGITMAKEMFKKEGVSSFFKATGFKTAASVGKLAFALTAARRITFWVDEKLSSTNNVSQQPHKPTYPIHPK